MSVRLISVYGSEQSLVQTSRVCTGNEAKDLNDTGKQIEALIKKKHWSVFEFADITCIVDAPIYVMRQWMRHSGSWMEKSRRYTKDVPTFGDDFESHVGVADQYRRLQDEDGFKPEEARKVLPLDLMTKCVWKVNLRDLCSFFRQRLDPHAQKEIRELAQDLLIQVYPHFPNVLDAFLTYDFGEVTMGLDTMFDFYMLQSTGHLATENSLSRIQAWGEKSEERLKLVKGIFDKVNEKIPNSSGDSGLCGVPPTDSEEGTEETGIADEAGAKPGGRADRFFRQVAEAEQAAASGIGKEDIGDVEVQLSQCEESFVSHEEEDEGPASDQTLAEFIDPKIVVGHFGSVHPG